MYLTPSVMAGIFRAFDALIVHPSEGYAQIATPVVLYILFTVGISVGQFLTN